MDEPLRAVWEAIDGMFSTVTRQGLEIGELRRRLADAEKKLADRGEEQRDEHDEGEGRGETAA